MPAQQVPARTSGPGGGGNAVFLVSCVSKKRDRPSAARDLYLSDWFLKARRYVESSGMSWFILSAEHGLLKPDTVISPYEKTLNTMGVAERRAWARRVTDQMEANHPPADRVVIQAGQRFREFLTWYLSQRFTRVEVPLEGLRIGEQLSWLGTHRPAPAGFGFAISDMFEFSHLTVNR